MRIKYLRLELLFTMFLASIFLFAIGCSSSISVKSPYDYDDGLSRSTPEQQGVPSETIARFFEQVQEKGYELHCIRLRKPSPVLL